RDSHHVGIRHVLREGEAMIRATLACLALTGCGAQAEAPKLTGWEQHRIEKFASECRAKHGEDKCLEACRSAFPDDGSDGNQERWFVCTKAVTKPLPTPRSE